MGRFNVPPGQIVTMAQYSERVQQIRKSEIEAATAEVASLRSQLTATTRRADQLQELLEKDQEAHCGSASD